MPFVDKIEGSGRGEALLFDGYWTIVRLLFVAIFEVVLVFVVRGDIVQATGVFEAAHGKFWLVGRVSIGRIPDVLRQLQPINHLLQRYHFFVRFSAYKA